MTEITKDSNLKSRNISEEILIAPKNENRMLYIDNLRIFLTILVIMHHSAITYSAAGSWVYYESSNQITIILLTWLTAIDQSFFMGLFFMLSGYFIPNSLERKGRKAYKKDRFIRLGIPLIVYTFVLNYFVWWMVARTVDGINTNYFVFVIQQLGDINLATGPLWFVLTLLVYTYGYIFIHRLYQRKRKNDNSKEIFEKISINLRSLTYFALYLGIITFLTRILFPSDFQIPLIEGLGFQLGYTPQYLTFFIIGILASQRKWLDQIKKIHAIYSLILSIIFGVGILVFALSMGVFNNYSGPSISGGFTWTSFVYSMIEAFLAVNLSVVLVYLFREKLNHQNRLGKMLSGNAYTAYIIHPIVVVGIALLLRPLLLFPLIKWVILSILAVLACFSTSAIIRKIPKITRILG